MQEILFKEWAEEWLETKRNFVKESTYATYLIAMVNHIIPAFGDEIVEEVTTKKIQDAVLAWSQNGKRNQQGGLAQKTIKDMVIIVKTCLKDYEESYGRDIRIRSIGYPRREENNSRREVLSEKQYEFLLNVIRENLEYETLGYAISLYTGVRIGELCALKWEDIDMEEKLISINKTLQRIYIKSGKNSGKTKVIITTPKSVKSVRKIPISNQLYRLLLRMSLSNNETYVLTGTSKYMEPRLYRTHYKKFLKNHKIEPIRFHGLRHTFATRCIEAGADYKIVSELLGHASVNITLNLYVHPQMEDKRRCVELL